ncbi:MAG: YitT family protein [Lachnospiraceae bacterium]|nr:YitT family protein [Lachnospiraceae bacterium]
MNRRITKMRLKDALIIFIGSTLIALAVQYVFDPAGLVTGGVSGGAIVIKAVSGHLYPGGVPLWVSNVLLNVPVFLFAIKTEGFRSVIKSGLSWIIVSLELMVMPEYDLLPDNLLLVSIYGGLLFGVGTGMLLLARCTSGGTDMLGKSLQSFVPHISMGRLIQILDGAVVVIGALVFNIEHTLFAIISVYITGRVTDKILDRGKRAKIALIISDAHQEICDDILATMDRGVTMVDGKGMYSGMPKKVIVCVCSNRDIPDLKDIVQIHDKKAFFVIGSISEALGEGFVEKWG